ERREGPRFRSLALHASAVLVAEREPAHQRPDPRRAGLRVPLAEITAQALGAGEEGDRRQPLDHLLDGSVGEFPRFEPPYHVQRQELDRVAQRVAFGLLLERNQRIGKLAVQRGVLGAGAVGEAGDRRRQQRPITGGEQGPVIGFATGGGSLNGGGFGSILPGGAPWHGVSPPF